MPPPSHIDCRPYLMPLSRMWCTSRVISTGPERGELLHGGVAAHALVGLEAGAGHDGVLTGECTGVDRGRSLLVRGEGELVELCAGQPPLLGDHLGTETLVDLLAFIAGEHL